MENHNKTSTTNKSLKIGSLTINGRSVLAPLAGITNLPFRRIAKQCNCALVCSEMVSAKGLLYHSKKTFTLLDSREEEKPLSVQLFGSNPLDMAEAAAIVEERGEADIIDINFGCSVKKVLKTGSGAALMKEPERTEKLITAVRNSISLPLTIKIRSGWDPSGDQALATAKIAEACGADAVVVHPRTAQQGFRGAADWQIIRRVREALAIPVIGNGDVTTPEQGLAMVNQTGCDGVMVGRGAMGNPFIFSGLEALFNDQPYREPGRMELLTVMKQLLFLHVDYFGEGPGVKMMRSRLPWFVKGMPGAAGFRRALSKIDSSHRALALMEETFQEQAGSPNSPPDHRLGPQIK
ncbi:MAG TPA: tRNA dihydrouridine synthase DusB [Desulfobacteraceae bacterium]|nr:tRNA dihydrouridine synthase DusB [Desulfobacteraceae bacterium]